MKIVIASGYFNPLHTGHVSYLEEAKKLGDKLIVIVNNDKQVNIKGSRKFMNEYDRATIVAGLKSVDAIWRSKSKDASVCKDLELLREAYPDDTLVFAKGGDRNINNIPEVQVCHENGIKMVFNVGDPKITSSSDILELYNQP